MGKPDWQNGSFSKSSSAPAKSSHGFHAPPGFASFHGTSLQKAFADGGEIGTAGEDVPFAATQGGPGVSVSSDPAYDTADAGGNPMKVDAAPESATLGAGKGSTSYSDYGDDTGRGAAGTSETTKADAPAAPKPKPRPKPTTKQRVAAALNSVGDSIMRPKATPRAPMKMVDVHVPGVDDDFARVQQRRGG